MEENAVSTELRTPTQASYEQAMQEKPGQIIDMPAGSATTSQPAPRPLKKTTNEDSFVPKTFQNAGGLLIFIIVLLLLAVQKPSGSNVTRLTAIGKVLMNPSKVQIKGSGSA